ARDARTPLRRGRGRATPDVPRTMAHAPRGTAAEVLHRHGRGDRPRGRLHVPIRLQPRVHAAPRPAPRPLPPARQRRVTPSAAAYETSYRRLLPGLWPTPTRTTSGTPLAGQAGRST